MKKRKINLFPHYYYFLFNNIMNNNNIFEKNSMRFYDLRKDFCMINNFRNNF